MPCRVFVGLIVPTVPHSGRQPFLVLPFARVNTRATSIRALAVALAAALAVAVAVAPRRKHRPCRSEYRGTRYRPPVVTSPVAVRGYFFV